MADYAPMSKDESIRVLAVVHPPERSGLHTFWSARWAALQSFGIDVTLVLPAELWGFAPRGIPADHVHYATLRRPRSLQHVGANMAYLAKVREDAREILRLAGATDSHILMSHGPHYLTVAVAARISKLPLAVLVHSGAAPSWSAQLLRSIYRPTVVGYELPSAKTRFAPLFRGSPSFQLAPVLDPSFQSDGVRTEQQPCVRVGFVAAFSPRKRVDKFLDLVEHKGSAGFEFQLIGSVAAGHTAWWAQCLQPRVDRLKQSGLLKFVDGATGVSEAFKQLDVLVITSDDEGIPNVAMEALSVGAVVVSLDLEGLAVLCDRLPEGARAAIRQVPRGPGELDRMLARLHEISPLGRSAIAEAGQTATSATGGASDIAAVLHRAIGTGPNPCLG